MLRIHGNIFEKGNSMSEDKDRKPSKKPDRLKPLSLYPLIPEKALGAFMRVKPKRVRSAEGKMEVKRKNPTKP